MGKNIGFVIAMSLLASSVAGLEKGAAGGAPSVSTRPFSRAGEGGSAATASAQAKIKPQWKSITGAGMPGGSTKGGEIVRVYSGDSGIKESYKINIPKNAHWRLLWSCEATEEREAAVIKIAVTSPVDKKYAQKVIKRIRKREGNVFGVLNICLITGGEFNIALDAYKCKWRMEIQLFK